MEKLNWALCALALTLAGCKSDDSSTQDAGVDMISSTTDGATTTPDGTVVVQSDAAQDMTTIVDDDGGIDMSTIVTADMSMPDMAPDAPPRDLTYDEFATAYANLYCAQPACANIFQSRAFDRMFARGTHDECVALVLPFVNNWMASNVGRGVRDGRIAFNAAGATACLRDAATDCDDVGATEIKAPVCIRESFTAAVAIGGTCNDDLPVNECIGGRCYRQWPCPGTCVAATKGAGDSCTESVECAAGTAGGADCAEGVCSQHDLATARAAIGEHCGGSRDWPPPPHNVSANCVLGAFCNEGTCAALLTEGQECRSDTQCAGEMLCRPNTSGPSTCQTATVTYLTTEGAACSLEGGTTALCDISRGLACQTRSGTETGECTSVGGGLDGDACSMLATLPTTGGVCAAGYFCSSDRTMGAGECEALVELGHECRNDSDCAEGICAWDSGSSRSLCTIPDCHS